MASALVVVRRIQQERSAAPVAGSLAWQRSPVQANGPPLPNLHLYTSDDAVRSGNACASALGVEAGHDQGVMTEDFRSANGKEANEQW